MESAMWMVRAGRNSAYVSQFLETGVVSMGYEDVGPLSAEVSRDEVLRKMREAYPARKDARNLNVASQLYRFHVEVREGHEVITYDASQRRYFVGQVRGAPEYVADGGEYQQYYRRAVDWSGKVLRDRLAVATKNTLGSTLTIFLLNEEAATDVRSKLVPLDAAEESAETETRPEEAAELDALRADMKAKANEFVEDLVAKLDAEQLEDLVAGILRAMGYKSRRSAKGPDRGVDIFASPDGIGLQEPRIFVECKHRKQSMGAQEVRSFLGGRQSGDRCLFVSTGGFTQEAKYEAERSNVPLTLVDLPTIRELLIEHYDAADSEVRRLVPLTRLYWPVEPE